MPRLDADHAAAIMGPMNRRKLVQILGLPTLVALGGVRSVAAHGRNRYYEGPVSDHFDGARFFVPGHPQPNGLLEFLRWQLGGERASWPEHVPSPFRDRPPASVDGLRVALVGHASLLIQVAGLNILIDPVWSERASPFASVGPKRVNAPGIEFDDLPPIHAVLVTHNHYDHLDLETVARLWHRFHPRIVAPLGNDTIIRDHDDAIVVEARDWGEAVRLSDAVSVHLEPANHWSARGLTDRRMALWCAFVLHTPKGLVYHVGDTGYGDGSFFRQVRERYGAPRLAILPIGAYEPRWFMRPRHINPEEAVRVLHECGAAYAIGHHWGTFQLTNEGIEAPVSDLAAALAAAAVPPDRFRAFRPGEVWEA